MTVRSLPLAWPAQGILRYSRWDALLVGLSVVHLLVIAGAPSIPAIAILLWWNSNTIAHNFIHLPFFHSRFLNRVYALYLTLILGFPQTVWRGRHLAHHQGRTYRMRLTRPIAFELVLLIALWTVMVASNPMFFFTIYIPGICLGLLLCQVHGYLEHWSGTISHYGAPYNLAFFNDGYHVEHHQRPGEHWSRLPDLVQPDAPQSAWPAVFRWVEAINLDTLERVTMRWRFVRHFLVKTHEQAFRKLLPDFAGIRSVKIVGGGLFPRTAIVIRKLMPDAEITIVDASARNLEIARRFLDRDIRLVNEMYEPKERDAADLLIVPLAFFGNREVLYRNPPARHVLIHDWMWRKRGESVVVSPLLLKRMNRIRAVVPTALESAPLVPHRLKPVATGVSPLRGFRSSDEPEPRSGDSPVATGFSRWKTIRANPSAVGTTALFGVLILAKIITLAGKDISVSAWAPVAYFWQDVFIAIVFAGIHRYFRRFGWALYAGLILYIAINVPITLALSSPLTPAMIRAAGGPLRDSITHYMTAANLGAMLLVVIAGVVFSRIRIQLARGVTVGAAMIILLGPYASSKVDTLGFDRNALTALWPVHLPKLVETAAANDWRASSFQLKASDDLRTLRGAAAGRNVIYVALESTAARYLRPFGAAENPMPHLSAIAEHAVLFDNAYAVYPESIKGLFSTLCSRYPAFNTTAEEVATTPCPSIAQTLKDSGYRTGLFHSGRFMYLGMQQIIEHRGYDVLEDAGAIGGEVNSSFGIDDKSTVRRMLSWIDAAPAGEKFFLTYLPIAGHHPYATPEAGPFPGDSDESNYRNALHYADAALADLFEGLRQRHLDEDTVFVIFGDHGEAFGQHPGNFGHTLFVYDENVHVPMMIVAPGLIRKQTHINRAASLIDASPTTLDLLGLPIPEQAQGGSLLDAAPRMSLFFTDYSLPLSGLRDGCWKFIDEIGAARPKLFNVCNDPGETIDLRAKDPQRTALYHDRLQHWLGY